MSPAGKIVDMKKRLPVVLFVVGIVGLWTLGGCSKSTGPKLYPVRGKVTYKGAPVDGANVMYRATDGSGSGAGRTDASGVYQITSQWGSGLPEGEYLVSITKFEERVIAEEDESYNPQLANMDVPPPKSLIPMKYSSPEQSGLKATVSKSGGTFDFDLTD